MSPPSTVDQFLGAQFQRRRDDLVLAAFAGAVTAAASVWLLGVSGWFLAGAALAGVAGPAAVQAFNYLLPSAALRSLAIARTGGRYGERLFGHRAALMGMAALRPALFAALAAAPPQAALGLSSGEAAARLVQDVGAIETAFVQRAAPWALAAAAGAASISIFLASPWAALIYVVGLGLQVVVVGRLAERSTSTAGQQELRAAGRLKDGLGAYLAAAEELYAYGLTGQAVDALMIESTGLGRARQVRHDAQARLALPQAIVTGVTLVLVALLAARTSLPAAALASLATLAGMEGTAGVLRAAQQQGAYREAVARLDQTMARQQPQAETRMGLAGLTLDDRQFAPGATVGLVGPSGCGKTSLIEMLVGLRPAEPGRVRVGGRPLESLPIGSARSLFAHAPQDARLLTGTLEENLRLGADEVDEPALWQALADAQLEARVRRMPDGLSTWVGDGGETLSGGERRRLSLARALLRPAAWLLLDEPTEGLDAETEALLVASLGRRLAATGQGVLVVSHRPAPLALCRQTVDLGLKARQYAKVAP